jgi:putative FmdB family regulatory protein
MPIYEYRCGNCHRKVSIFWRSFSAVDESKAQCTFCGSTQLSRLASRVRVIRGGGGQTDSGSSVPDADDGADAMMNELSGLDENDPRALGHFMRKMAAEAGEEMGPEFDEIVGRLEKGEDPEKIEQNMGDLLGEPGGEMGGMMDDEMAPPPAPPAEEAEGKAKPGQGEDASKKPTQRVVHPKSHRTPKSKATGKSKAKARTTRRS